MESKGERSKPRRWLTRLKYPFKRRATISDALAPVTIEYIRGRQEDNVLDVKLEVRRNLPTTQLNTHVEQPSQTQNEVLTRAIPPSGITEEYSKASSVIKWPEPFWSEAVQRLQRERPNIYRDLNTILGEKLKDSRSSHSDLERLASDVLHVAQGEKEKTEQKASSDRRRIFHDSIGYSKAILEKAKSLLDLDPTGYGKLACVPLILALDLVTRSHEAYEDALNAFSFISLLLCRYEEREKDYKKHQAENETQLVQLEKLLPDLYFEVLLVLVDLAKHFQRQRYEQILRSTVIDIDGWKVKMKVIKEKDDQCQGLFKIIDSKHAVTRDIHDRMKFFDEAKKRDDRNTRIEKALRWTSEHDYLGDYRNIIGRLSKTPGTGSWIFKHNTFLKWNSSIDQGLRSLWLHGPVGCGKTTLITRVIERLLESSRDFPKNENRQVAYFYCSKTQGSGSQPSEVLASIVRQLSSSPKSQQATQPIMDHWKHFLDQDNPNENPPKLDLQECENLLGKIFGLNDHITIIIDALDECADPRELLEVFQNFEEQLHKRPTPTIRVLFSSRDEVQVLDQLNSNLCGNLMLTPADTANDLQVFIESGIKDAIRKNKSHPLSMNNELRRDIIDALVEHGKGAFKWTQLHLAMISNFGNETDIRTSLDEIKAKASSTYLNKTADTLGSSKQLLNLYDTYELLYKQNMRVGRNAEVHFQRLMRLVLTYQTSERQTSILKTAPTIELLIGVAITDPNEAKEPEGGITKKYIERITSNFLVVNKDSTVEFAHVSVKEYLQHARSGDFSDIISNIYVAASCLSSIKLFHGDLTGATLKSILEPIWPQPPAKYFMCYSILFWGVHCKAAGQEGRQVNPLKDQFSEFILTKEVGNAYKAWFRAMDPAPYKPPDPFFMACANGYNEAVAVISQHRPEVVNIPFGARRSSGLHLAALYNNSATVRELIHSNGIDTNAKDGNGLTALADEAIDINSMDPSGRTPLSLAEGREGISTLLLNRGADPKIADYSGRTNLWFTKLREYVVPKDSYENPHFLRKAVSLAMKLAISLAHCEFLWVESHQYSSTSHYSVVHVLWIMLAELEVSYLHNEYYKSHGWIFRYFTFNDPNLSKYGIVVKVILEEFRGVKSETFPARHFILQHIVRPLDNLYKELMQDCGHEFDDDDFPVVSGLVNWEFVWNYYNILEDKEEVASDRHRGKFMDSINRLFDINTLYPPLIRRDEDSLEKAWPAISP